MPEVRTRPDRLRRTVDAARRLDCRPKTLERWAREGKIPSVRVGRHWKFLDSDLEEFIRANRKGAA